MEGIDLASTRARLEAALAAPSGGTSGLNTDLMYIRQVYLGMGKHFNLSPSEAMLLALVHTLSRDGAGWCYMGQKGLGAVLNVSPQTIGEIIERLERKGLLNPGPKHPRFKTNQWKLSLEALDRLRYLQDKIARQSQRKRGYQNQYQ